LSNFATRVRCRKCARGRPGSELAKRQKETEEKRRKEEAEKEPAAKAAGKGTSPAEPPAEQQLPKTNLVFVKAHYRGKPTIPEEERKSLEVEKIELVKGVTCLKDLKATPQALRPLEARLEEIDCKLKEEGPQRPMETEVVATRGFLDRARKRLGLKEEELVKVQEECVAARKEVADAEEKLRSLEEQMRKSLMAKGTAPQCLTTLDGSLRNLRDVLEEMADRKAGMQDEEDLTSVADSEGGAKRRKRAAVAPKGNGVEKAMSHLQEVMIALRQLGGMDEDDDLPDLDPEELASAEQGAAGAAQAAAKAGATAAAVGGAAGGGGALALTQASIPPTQVPATQFPPTQVDGAMGAGFFLPQAGTTPNAAGAAAPRWAAMSSSSGLPTAASQSWGASSDEQVEAEVQRRCAAQGAALRAKWEAEATEAFNAQVMAKTEAFVKSKLQGGEMQAEVTRQAQQLAAAELERLRAESELAFLG